MLSSPISINMPTSNNEEKPKIFRPMPLVIIINILSRLSIRTIVICKCVCRSWRDLLCSREFADSHLSKSVPGLIISNGIWGRGLNKFKLFEFDGLCYKPLAKIDSLEFAMDTVLQGSTNGLLLLRKDVLKNHHVLYICNPITREYIELPINVWFVINSYTIFAYGFGVSIMSGQHKVVMILHERNSCRDHTLQNVTMSICHVYTLGTGIWRSVTSPTPFVYDLHSSGLYLNGNLHWLVQVLDYRCISCFDLDTETFSMFPVPPLLASGGMNVGLAVLEDCLCVSDNTSADGIDIWLMKDYGDVKSWTKEFVIGKSLGVVVGDFGPDIQCGVVHPIKVFENGDMLMALWNACMICYSNKTKTIELSRVFGEDVVNLFGMVALLHTSSSLSLASFVYEGVNRF